LPEHATKKRRVARATGLAGEGAKPGGKGDSVLDLQERVGNDETVKTVLGPGAVAEFAKRSGKAGPRFFTTATYTQLMALLTAYTAKQAGSSGAGQVDAIEGVLETWFERDKRENTDEAKAQRAAMEWLRSKVTTERRALGGEGGGDEPVDDEPSVDSLTGQVSEDDAEPEPDQDPAVEERIARNDKEAEAREQLPDVGDEEATRATKMSTEQQRAKYKLHLGAAITQGQDDDLFDTKRMSSAFSGSGVAVFVMSSTGDIYAGSNKAGIFRKASFVGGSDVAASGEIAVSNGRLTMISNKSANLPNHEQNLEVIEALQAAGISPASYEFTYLAPSGTEQTFASARAYMKRFGLR